ncbi:MAG: hypothetical protein H6706_22080 [Myxococcales bacterium]|nr:hypothetical protein [Myxococcales bacterium]
MRTALALALLLGQAAQAQPITLQQFQTSDPDVWERVHRSSDSLPLTLEELEKLAAAGVAEATLNEMMRTRGVLALADADALLKLKKAGATDAALSALSAYAVKPNDFFLLKVDLDLASNTSIGPAPYLYIEVKQPGEQRQEAFYFIDLRSQRASVRRDRSDPTLPETVAAIDFVGKVRTRRHGPLELRVAVSQRTDLQSLDGKPDGKFSQVKVFQLDYPAVSLDRRCEVRLRVARDPSIRDFYTLQRGTLDCRWD